MGLDMYLTKRVYVQNWAHFSPERVWEISVKQGGKTVKLQSPVNYLILGAAYWRKANCIHKWFVDNCQDGRDECQESWVDREKLKELLALCKKVLTIAVVERGEVLISQSLTDAGWEGSHFRTGTVITNAPEIAELLPSESGFFFGSTSYDEFYLDDIRLTINQLTKALADPLDGEFYYQASW